MKKIVAIIFATLSVLAFTGRAIAAPEQPDKCFETVYKDILQKQTRTLEGEGEWSKWTFWDNTSVVDDGRDRGPLPHNDVTPGEDGYREYRYVVLFPNQPQQVEVDCVPETTVPETTVPDVVIGTPVEEIRDICHINGSTAIIPEGAWKFYPEQNVGTHSISGMPCGPITPGTCMITGTTDTIPAGDFELVDPTVDAVGTHSISGMPCNPISTATDYPPQPSMSVETTVPVPQTTTPANAPQTATQAPMTLPETGTASTVTFWIAFGTIIAGLMVWQLSKR